MDSVYSAYKSHCGSAWGKYDEDFRRRLSLQPEIGWGVKATDVWLRLMMAQKQSPFQSAAAASGSGTSHWPSADREHVGCTMRDTVSSSVSVSTSMNAPPVAVLTQSPVVPAPLVRPLSPRVAPKGKTPVSVTKMLPWLDIYPDRHCCTLVFPRFFFLSLTYYLVPPSFHEISDPLGSCRMCCEKKFLKKLVWGAYMAPFLLPPFPISGFPLSALSRKRRWGSTG